MNINHTNNNNHRKKVQISTFYSSNTNCSSNRSIHSSKIDNNYRKPVQDKAKYLSTNNSNNNIKLNSSKYSINSDEISNASNSTIKYMIDTIDKKEKNLIKNNKQISLLIKQKIENAKKNEEIVLPSEEIELENLTIKSPIRIKGQTNSVLYIKEGPILIDFINSAYEKNFVKISQLRIIYTDNKLNKEKKITTLFKIYPSAFLELEDCDIVFQNKKGEIIPPGLPKHCPDKKSVAFLHFSNKKTDQIKNIVPSMLNLTNTRVQNFFQSIRAGQNCIVNINKCAFIQNSGKAIVMINPIFIKLTESFFEYNGDNCVHLKFIEDCLYEEKRKLFFNKNEFNLTMGNDICIEGVQNHKLDISVSITKNNFVNSSNDAVLAFDVYYNYFELNENLFKKNNGNGLYLQKVFSNEVNTDNNNFKMNSINLNSSNQLIKIKDNKFIENKGFGIFVNDCLTEIISNKFCANRQSGLFLGNILVDEPKKGLDGINIKKINIEKNNNNITSTKRTILLKNSFYENGSNGLHIYQYPYQIDIIESVFTSNYRNGISIDLIEDPNINKALSDFKSNINNSYNMAHMRLNKSVIEKNMKSGINISYGLIFCEETFIVNNIDYVICTKKKEYKDCLKEGKQCVINGTLGGNWGEINLNKSTSCGFSCMPKKDFSFKLKDEIVKKVPSLNDSEDFGSSISYNELKCDNNNKNNNNNKDKSENKCNIF